MIVLSNSQQQTLLPGQSVTFDLVKLHSGCAECHRQGSSSVKLRAPGIYEVHFNGNISGTVAGALQLNMELGGEVLPETLMQSALGTPGDFDNVSATTLVRNCCGDFDRITVTNTGTSDVVVAANSALVISRRSGS